MTIDSITELQKAEIEEVRQNYCTRNYGAPIKNALLSGVVMSVIAVIVWFLLSRTVKSVGVAMLIVTVTLVASDTLIFVMLKSKHRKWKMSARVAMVIYLCLF